MSESKLIKVCLTNRGEDTETPWAHDLGPAPGPDGSRKVKLVNVPFMHAKPTWGDTIVVSPVKDGFPTWDREGTPWRLISSRIVEDGGRWAMIVDYAPRGVSGDEAFQALARACDTDRVVCEGAWGPTETEPGRAYLAVQREMNADDVMAKLLAADLPCRLIQVHPEPKKITRAATKVGIADETRPPGPVAAKSALNNNVVTAEPSVIVDGSVAKPTVASGKPTVASGKPTVASGKPPAAAKPAATAVKLSAKPEASTPARVAAKTAKPTPKQPAKRAAKPTAKPVAKRAAKPTAKPAAKPAAKPTAKPAAKPAAKPGAKPRAKPTAKPVAKRPAAKKR
ncbi:MAG: hypothetical protein AB7L28_27540 [Kofleriaceae bacterium]